MQVKNATTEQIYHIQRSGFDATFLAQCKLFLKIHQSSLSLAVFDVAEDRFIWHDYYRFSQMGGTLLATLQELWEQHGLLGIPLWHEVVVIFANQDFTFVPFGLVEDEEEGKAYLRLNIEYDASKQLVFHAAHKGYAANCFFAASEELCRWLEALYTPEKIHYLHFNSCFLKGVASFHKLADASTFFVNIESDLITMIHLKNEKLNFINTFRFSDENDLVYYVLLVIEQLGVIPQAASVTLWGSMDGGESIDDNMILLRLKEYIGSVSIGKRPMHLKFIEEFDELPLCREFDLFTAQEF